MQRWAITGLGLTLGLFAAGPLWGADAPAAKETPAADLTKAAVLVKKLGDTSYETRRDADKELREMGRTVEKILRDNVTNPDMEISRRCERLLALATRSDTEVALDAFLQNKDDKLLLKLPAWTRFSEMAGKDDAARMLFVDMYGSEGGLLEALEKDPKTFGTKFSTRVTQLQQILYTPWGTQGSVTLGQVVALLFVASDSRMTFDMNSFYMVTQFLWQQNIQQAFRNDAGSRKILAAFIEKRSDQNTLQQVLPLVLQLEIKEMVPVALKLATAKEKEVPAYNKATAVMIVGRLGAKEEAEKLEPLLTDTSNLGAMMVGTTRIEAQLRDVALAAIIEANGQTVSDYGFPYLQTNQVGRGAYMAPQWYGFAKDADRKAALDKFREWQKKQKK